MVSTWLWGSLSTRYGMVDPLADLYSLNVVFLEASGLLARPPASLPPSLPPWIPASDSLPSGPRAHTPPPWGPS